MLDDNDNGDNVATRNVGGGEILLPLLTPRLHFAAETDADYPRAEALWCDDKVNHYFGGAMTVDQANARHDAERECEMPAGVQYWQLELRKAGEFAGCEGLSTVAVGRGQHGSRR